MKLAVALTIAMIANSLGNLFLSIGMKQYGDSPTLDGPWLLQTAYHVVTNGWLITGVALLVVFLASYMTALSWADLSFVLPATAPAYFLNAALSRIFLNEQISLVRWAGTLLIVTGTWLVSRTYISPAPAASADGPAVEDATVSEGSES